MIIKSHRILRAFTAMFLCISTLLLCCHVTQQAYAAPNTEVSTLAELKTALESPDASHIVVTKEIVVDQPIVIPASAVKTLTHQDGGSLVFGLANNDSDKLGDAMITVSKGAELTIGESGNTPLLFDGKKTETNTSVSGIFLTIKGKTIINNGEFTGCNNKGMSSAPIYVDGGELTVNNINMHDNLAGYVETIANHKYAPLNNLERCWAKSSAIAVTGKGSATINNGTFTKNNLEDHPNFGRLPFPGAFAVNEGTLTINNGTFTENFGYYGGVAMSACKGKLIINGGTFTKNTAKICGGALAQDMGSSLEIHGGTFSNNHSPNGGVYAGSDRYREAVDEAGGSKISDLAKQVNVKSIDEWSKVKLGSATYDFTSNIKIDGNPLFENNSADIAGGALFISVKNSEIDAATFKNNSSTRFGGAIYLSSVPYQMHLKNVYMANNKALDKGADLAFTQDNQNIALKKGSGGGLWYCPTGNAELNVSNGYVFADNTAVHDGDDLTTVTKRHHVDTANNDPDRNKDFTATITNRMLGGGHIDWYADGSGVADGVARYKSGDKPGGPINNTDENKSLKGISSDDAKALGKSLATVVFEGNTSGRGGAIGTNGTVIIGDANQTFDMKIIKKWSDKIDPKTIEGKKVTMNLLNATDPNHKYVIDTVELSKDNSWTATITNLPLEAGNKKIRYEVQEDPASLGTDFTATVEVSGSGADKTAVDTSTIQPGSTDTLVTVTNTPVAPPTPPTPPNPENPTPPTPPNPDNPTPSTPPHPPAPEQPLVPVPLKPVASSAPKQMIPRTSDKSVALILVLGGFTSLLAAGGIRCLHRRNVTGQNGL